MRLNSIFLGRRKILAFISLGFILVGFIGGIVSGHNWWTKSKPWLKYGEATCWFHYYLPYIIWIDSIIGLILLVLIFTFIFIKIIAESKCLSKYLLVLLFISSIISWVFGIIMGAVGFSDSPYSERWEDGTSYKCYSDIYPSLFISILDKAVELNKTVEYYNWSFDFYQKIMDQPKTLLSFSGIYLFFIQYPDLVERKVNITDMVQFWFGMPDFSGDTDRKSIFKAVVQDTQPKFTDYLCSKVATPMLSFAVISFVGDVLLLIASCQCNRKEKTGDSLDNDEDQSDIG